jgi:membrane-associated phospholipid phosphatase
VIAALLRADTAILRVASTRGHAPAAVAAAKRLSHLGEHAALWLAVGAAGSALDAPRRSRWNRGLRAIAITYVANVAIKNVVRRRRPLLDGAPQLIKTPTQLSFPSAHAASSFAAARAYAPLLGARTVYPLAVAMAASRVYLGVHYPSDILAGATLGTLVSGATTR